MPLTRSLRTVLAAGALARGAVATPARGAHAQSPAEHVAMGDRDRYVNPAAALRHYEAAIAGAPNNADALAKASIAAVDVGEATSDKGRQKALYAQGEQLARRAIATAPNDADGHFALARALGRTAQTLGSRERVKYAGEVRAHALDALKRDPMHAGALHVMGMWNAEVMRLNGVSRFMAKNLLGGRVFDQASWNNAQSYMERAVAVEPNRLTHRLDLAGVYLDRNNSAKAKEQLDFIAPAPAREAGDAQFKRQAEAMRSRL